MGDNVIKKHKEEGATVRRVVTFGGTYEGMIGLEKHMVGLLVYFLT